MKELTINCSSKLVHFLFYYQAFLAINNHLLSLITPCWILKLHEFKLVTQPELLPYKWPKSNKSAKKECSYKVELDYLDKT